MNDRNLDDLCPTLKPLAQQFLDNCRAAGIHAIITETYRSSADQDADYACGRTAPGFIKTYAKGGQSAHNCTIPDGTDDGKPAAKGFDFAIIDATGICDWDATDPEWQAAIKIGENLGLVSGSRWHCLKDNPHFELPNWKQSI